MNLAEINEKIPQTINDSDAVIANAVSEILLVTTSNISNIMPSGKWQMPSIIPQNRHGHTCATFSCIDSESSANINRITIQVI